MVTRYSQLTLQHKQQIIDAFNNGMGFSNIPIQLGISSRGVSRVLAEAGINTRRKNRYTLNETYFQTIDSQTKAYLLGLMAADGCVTQTNYVVFESVDKELVKLLQEEIQYSGEIRIINFPNYAPHYRINFSSKQLASDLSRYAVVAGRGVSGVYYFPELEYLGSYILGYFDGDGCAYVNKGRSGGLVCIVGSFDLISELARLLGMGVVVEHQSKTVYYWRIYSRENIKAFYQFIYQQQGLGLQRKKQKIEQILESYKRG